MAQNVLSCDREQKVLLPPNLRDWLGEDHLVGLVLDAVEVIDLAGFMWMTLRRIAPHVCGSLALGGSLRGGWPTTLSSVRERRPASAAYSGFGRACSCQHALDLSLN
jgi:hypothetical protein